MLIEKLQNQLKVEIKKKNRPLITTLRNLIGKLKVAEINKGKKINDEESIKILQKIAKQHRDSIKQFSIGGRSDLVKIEELELSVVEEFLPKQISNLELEKKVVEIIKQTNANNLKDIGVVMSVLMKEFSGKVDGNNVKKIVMKKLNS